MIKKVYTMDGFPRIEKVVLLFDVWLDASLFPFAKMKVKVIERKDDFIAVSNLNLIDGGQAGLGDSADEALHDLLTRFVSDARQRAVDSELAESDFGWADPQDF